MLGLDEDTARGRIRAEPRVGGDRYVRREAPLVSSLGHLAGRCTNDMFCHEAVEKTEVFVPQGSPFVCPACSKPLALRPEARRQATRARVARGGMPVLNQGAVLKGRCDNVRRCTVARGRNAIFVRVGNVFVCPECSKPLAMADAARPATWARPLAGCAALGLICVVTTAMLGWPGQALVMHVPVATMPAAIPKAAPATLGIGGGDNTSTDDADMQDSPPARPVRARKSAPHTGHAHHSAAIPA